MGREEIFEVKITQSALKRYQEEILFYLYSHFSFERAEVIESRIFAKVQSLSRQPNRGPVEKNLSQSKTTFRFVLFKETRVFELKIIFQVDVDSGVVNVTDFFPTSMDLDRLKE